MFTGMKIDNFGPGTVLILVVVIAAGFGQVLVHQFLGKEKVKTYHEVGGYYMSVVGTIYSVLLGLIVFHAMNKFEDAKHYVEIEATSFLEVYIIADRMPNIHKEKIRSLVQEYVNEVIHNEWRLMAESKKSEKARSLMLQLTRDMITIEPKTENQKILYQSLMSSLQRIWENRRARINFAEFAIPNVEWFVLIAGGVVTVFFTYFFSMQCRRTQFVMTALITLIVAMSLYLVLLFGQPYSGDLKVSTNSFDLVQEYFNSNP